jgi:predicted O-methyltransferase YrrM
MGFISTFRRRARSWIDQGKYPWLTRPLHGAWRAGVNAYQMAVSPIVVRRTRRVPAGADAGDMAQMVASNHFFGVIHAMQVPSEVRRMVSELTPLRPKRLLEIGTAGGGTLFMITRAVDPQALVISVDLPAGMWGGGYPLWKSGVYRGMALPGQRVELVRGDSHAPQSLERVRAILGAEQLDFLFIDGDHTYEGVKKDLEMYGPLVRKGGIIGFHDIEPHPSGNGGDVPRFWREVAQTREVQEFVENPNGGYGIGLIRV